MTQASTLIRHSVFAVTGSGPSPGGRTFGTAFVVHRTAGKAYLLTCAHVIRDVGGREHVKIGTIQARVVAMGAADGPDDLAVLEADLPGQIRPICLDFSAGSARDGLVWGYDEVGSSSALRDLYQLRKIEVVFGQQLTLRRADSLPVAAWLIEIAKGTQLPSGFSGSPVMDAMTGEAIGIATIAKEGSKGIAVAVETLRQLWPEGVRWIDRPRLTHQGIELVYVPAGEFTMGTMERQADELARIHGRADFTSEKPQGIVHAPSYYISRFPVTNAQYAPFIRQQGRRVPYRVDALSSRFSWDPMTRQYPSGHDNLPVVLVTWHDARAFCRWVGGYLPTEAQWEKAARGSGDAREWPWGDDWNQDCCNTSEGGAQGPSPVGQFSPAGDSPYGVADMSGNVWEWCSSLYAPYPYTSDDGRERVSATGPRVLRGGTWGNNRYLARCAARNSTAPDDSGFTIGFRVAFSRQTLLHGL